MRLLEVSLRTASDFICRGFHDAISRQHLCRPPEIFQLRPIRLGRLAGHGEIDHIVLCRDSTREREDRWDASRKFRGYIPSPSALLWSIRALPPLALNVFESVFWKDVFLISGAGTHTRVASEDFRTSTRVVTSNVRQLAERASSANKHLAFENPKLVATAPALRRKCRRFTEQSFQNSFGLTGILRCSL
jgi:hypothetical protein